VKAVRGQLDLISKLFVQVADETHSVRNAALSDAVRRDQLSVCIQCNENPLVAYFRAASLRTWRCFLRTKDQISSHCT
jgi:hypothetical protein